MPFLLLTDESSRLRSGLFQAENFRPAQEREFRSLARVERFAYGHLRTLVEYLAFRA